MKEDDKQFSYLLVVLVGPQTEKCASGFAEDSHRIG